jgi:hypothetical protein
MYRIYWLNLIVYKCNSKSKFLTLEVTLSTDGTIITVDVK